jgi:hypothetical protein
MIFNWLICLVVRTEGFNPSSIGSNPVSTFFYFIFFIRHYSIITNKYIINLNYFIYLKIKNLLYFYKN